MFQHQVWLGAVATSSGYPERLRCEASFAMTCGAYRVLTASLTTWQT